MSTGKSWINTQMRVGRGKLFRASLRRVAKEEKAIKTREEKLQQSRGEQTSGQGIRTVSQRHTEW